METTTTEKLVRAARLFLGQSKVRKEVKTLCGVLWRPWGALGSGLSCTCGATIHKSSRTSGPESVGVSGVLVQVEQSTPRYWRKGHLNNKLCFCDNRWMCFVSTCKRPRQIAEDQGSPPLTPTELPFLEDAKRVFQARCNRV